MYIEKIKLTNFKNYENYEMEFSPTLNCIVGRNGIGKTNLLDAIHYLCLCKSHFQYADTALVKHGESFFRLEGIFERKNKKEEIIAKLIPRKKKSFERNKIEYTKLSEHIGFLPIVMIAPDDIQLATDGSEYRRRFADYTLSQTNPTYLHELIHYNRILEQRNAVLKQYAETGKRQDDLLDIYDQKLWQIGIYIFHERQKWTKELIPYFQTFYKIISESRENVSLNYESEWEGRTDQNILLPQRNKDYERGFTTIGIHKDDWSFFIKNQSLKKFASQGQLKSYILALRLAQYQYISKAIELSPILLLDDLFDKLDEYRVRQLLTLLSGGDFGQIFITDTHTDRMENILQSVNKPYKKINDLE